MKKRVMWRGVVGVSLAAAAVAVVGAGPASAGRSDAEQIANLNTLAVETDMGDMLTVGSKVFFSSDDNVHGEELFVTDGTEAGTKMVKDINPDGNSSEPREFAGVSGTLYFVADDGTNGQELWKTDGTEAGTVMVKDINSGSGSSYPDRLVNLNGTLLFTAYNGTNGTELWKSDGTEAGTVLVKDIAPTNTGEYPASVWYGFAVLGSTAYFGADDGTNGVELWKTDGTEAGTVMVQDMNPGSASTYPDPHVAAGAVWFQASEPANSSNFHLWKYDGTTLTDVKTFAGGGIESDRFLDLDGTKVLFVAFDRVAENGWELWVSDGTTGGTTLVKDINDTGDYADSDPAGFVKMGTKVYFSANDGTNGRALWVTDGTTGGTTMVKDLAPSNNFDPNIDYLTVVGSTLYFRANDNPGSDDDDAPTPRGSVGGPNVSATLYGEELWKSDGTEAGTVLVKDINPGEDDGSLNGSRIDSGGGPFQVLGTSIYFFADDGDGKHLWTSDGTEANTKKLADISITNEGSNPRFQGVSGNKAYFSARGTTGGGLFVTDGTAAGTIRLTNNSVDEVAIIGQKAYFRGYDETNGGGLWETDGTLLGTKLVKDPNPSGPYSDMGYLTALGSKVLFVADNGVDGIEWWVSDGTEAGTNLLKDIGPGPQGGDIEYPTVVGSLLYFQADDGTNGLELWVTDGTEAGTKMLKDVDPGSDTEGPCYRPCSGDPRDFVAVGTNVFFTANTTATGRELWKTDGTAAGTVLVKDIYTGTSYGYPNNSYPNGMTELSGKLYFWANDGSGGAQLWTSDGTELGTKLLKLVNPNGYGSNQIAKANNRLFFAQYDDTNGSELWTSDGTEAGTTVVTNINTGSDGSSPDGLVSAPTAVYFRAYNGTTWGIYSSDGTEAGTKFLAAYDEGEFTARYIPFRGGLLYTNDNGTDGVELWAVGLPEGTAQTISFTPPANMKANEVVALTGTATSGLPVTYLASGQCEIKKTGKDAGKLKLKGQGFCTVRAMQGGDETWAAADDVEMTILIGKNSVVVKFIGVVPARKNSVSAFAFYSGLVQLKAEVTPALEGCEVQFTVSPNSATPAGPYTAISDEDGVVLSEPITIAPGTYDFTVTPLGDCEGTQVDAPRVYLGELPPTGADTTVFVWIGATLLAAGTLLVSRQRRRTA